MNSVINPSRDCRSEQIVGPRNPRNVNTKKFSLIDQYERQTQSEVDDTKFDLVPLNLFELRSLFVFTFIPCLCFEQIAPTAGGDRASILNIEAIKNECGSVAVELNSYRDFGGVAFSPLTRVLGFKRTK